MHVGPFPQNPPIITVDLASFKGEILGDIKRVLYPQLKYSPSLNCTVFLCMRRIGFVNKKQIFNKYSNFGKITGY